VLAALAWIVAIALVAAGLGAGPATALKATPVNPDLDRADLTMTGEFVEGRGDRIQIETAAGADGVVGRMTVRAQTPGTSPSWIVFALTNPGNRPIERWLTAERYTVVGSGVIWPDLDARRIEALTPSVGFLPERVKSDRADIFKINLDAGQTITYVAELSGDRFAWIYLWKPVEYELKARERQLLNGVMLGITGLLGIFLTALFAANHKAIFPSAALVSWCVLAHLCVDFGFWHKLFQLRAEDNAVYRAATEAAIAASLVIFLHTFLRIGSWNGFIRMLFGVWMVAQLSLIAIAVVDPRLASTFARASFLAIGGVGALLMLFLALRGQDRALALVPTWILFLVWIFGAGVILTGRLSGDAVVSGLIAGLVLLVVLMGFTVTQFAFRTLEPLFGTTPSEQQLRVLAVDGAGAAVWEWNARRDEIKVSPLVESALGLNAGELSTKVEDFARHLHPADRERFNLMLWSVKERKGGAIRLDLRMRHADNTYRWFDLEASSVTGADPRSLRCVGLMRDVTETRRAHERLMHDAVHDTLTGLPNRQLFLDRLDVACARAKSERAVRPTVLFIDVDKFKSVNSTFGLIVGDSLLLTTARRLSRHLNPGDTLARVSGDQFAMLLLAEQDPRGLAMLAERVRQSVRAPIKIAGQDIVLTVSVGIAVYDAAAAPSHDLLKEAEIAMYRAKRGGADRVELFRAEMRADPDDRIAIESELRAALEKQQLRVLYQPIIYLPTEELAGFEALVRWEHPRYGMLNPDEFIPVAEESDLIVRLGSFVLTRAAQDAARWQKDLPRPDEPLFVSVNVSSRQLFRQDLIQEIRHILGRALVPPGSLRLEVTESLVMDNPEQAIEILEWLRGAGARLALDDFGTGYSSLAYLQRFPFDTIKIDRDIVQAGSADGAGAAIVRSIVALAHELGKRVVAEGVEAGDDVAFLRTIACEYAQGFYYGEPMPEREVTALLKMIRKSERKLQRRGFFRTKPKPTVKSKPARRRTERPAAIVANGAAAPEPAQTPAAATGPAPPPAMAAEPVARMASAMRVRPRAPAGTAAGAAKPNGAGAPRPAIEPLSPSPLQPSSQRGGNPPHQRTQTVPPSRPPPLPPALAPAAPPGPPPLPTGDERVTTRPPTRAAAPASPVNGPATVPTNRPSAAPSANLAGLPPAIAASLAKLAGPPAPVRPATTVTGVKRKDGREPD
jgi:diguanylate cyclase (GGDEF)-like protein